MASHLNDWSERRDINKRCTLDNKHLPATMSGVIKLIVQHTGKEVEVRIKDILWIPEVPCRLESIRRHTGEFLDSGISETAESLQVKVDQSSK